MDDGRKFRKQSCITKIFLRKIPKLWLRLKYFCSEKKRKTCFSFVFLSLNRTFAADMKKMDQETEVRCNRFGNVIKSSMKRRCEGIDYKGRKMYMVTLVTENRRALFGEIVGLSNAPKNSADAPHINLTPLGERVRDNFLSIQNRYEEVKVIALQMMPDHLHGILFVTTQMQQHLGQVISGFKSGCNKDYRELILGKGQSSVELDVTMPQSTRQATKQTMPSASLRKRPPREAYDREHGLLFESGYNDKILLREGQLERWLNYLPVTNLPSSVTPSAEIIMLVQVELFQNSM